MSSSTSSFKTELKVFATAAVLLAAAQTWQYFHFHATHPEAKLLTSLPAMAEDLSKEPGTHVVLLGNSLTKNGYDMPLLKDELHAAGRDDLHIENAAFYGSNPMEWYYVFDRNFVRTGHPPDYIVINMSPSGIADELPQGYRIGWLAQETRWADVPQVLGTDLRDVEIGGQYLQARVSMPYATRWDIRIEVLSHLIPPYKAGMEWVNQAAKLQAKTGAGAKEAPPPLDSSGRPPAFAALPNPPYGLITRMLERARESHVRVILVAMPARDFETVDANLMKLLAAHDVTFIDGRNFPGQVPELFEPDGWHLQVETGGKLFTKFMAKEFASHISTSPSSGSAPITVP